MNSARNVFLFTVVILLMVIALSGQTQPVPIIFDTDIDTDCDDTGALAMLHGLANLGEAEILATIVSSHYPWSAACVEAINRYYNRAELPIAVPKKAGAPINRGSRYAKQVAHKFIEPPKTNDYYPDAVDVYRRVLSKQKDKSVVIVTVGYLTNLKYLLDSKADLHSSLNGKELIAKKVHSLVCMGGRYPKHLDPKVYGNFKPDPDAAVRVAKEWPTTIIFSGLGTDVLTGDTLHTTPDNNPVKMAYKLYLGNKPARPSWDLFAVLYAVRPNLSFWKMQKEGYNHIFDNGTNEWRDENNPKHWLLKVEPKHNQQIKNTMNKLMTMPPK